MRLYEISEQFNRLIDAIEDGEIPEDAINDTFESVKCEFEQKADNIACLIKNLKSEYEAIHGEIQNLKQREHTKKSSVDRLKSYLRIQMTAVGTNKIETSRNKILIRKNPPSVEFENEEAFISWAKENANYLLDYAEPTPSKKSIKEELKNGKELPNCRLVQNERLDLK